MGISKLFIAIPVYDYMQTNFVISLSNLITKLTDDKIDFEIAYEKGSLLYLNRERLTKRAIEGGFSHILWLDSDMVFDADVIDKLYSDDREFTSCIYCSRHGEQRSIIFSSLDPATRVEDWPDDIFEIAACGFGCCLGDIELFKDIKEHYGTCFEPLGGWGEDFSFCIRANRLGHKLYANPNVAAGHISNTILYPKKVIE